MNPKLITKFHFHPVRSLVVLIHLKKKKEKSFSMSKTDFAFVDVLKLIGQFFHDFFFYKKKNIILLFCCSVFMSFSFYLLTTITFSITINHLLFFRNFISFCTKTCHCTFSSVQFGSVRAFFFSSVQHNNIVFSLDLFTSRWPFLLFFTRRSVILLFFF